MEGAEPERCFVYHRPSEAVFGPVNGGSSRGERRCVGAAMKIHPGRVGGGRHRDTERWGSMLYKGREAGGLVDKPHATFDGVRSGGVIGELHQVTCCRCGEIVDVHAYAGGSQVDVRAYVQNFCGVRLDPMCVENCLREGRKSDHQM